MRQGRRNGYEHEHKRERNGVAQLSKSVHGLPQMKMFKEQKSQAAINCPWPQ
jgi:hypothetical protein